MEKQKDASQVTDLTVRIQTKFFNAVISSHSFDKGFWSKDNLAILEAQKIETVVLPKRGRQTKEDKEREDQPDFKLLRRKHSAVESNINMLEHHGLNRCPDKGLRHYKNYVGLSVLAYNLHQLIFLCIIFILRIPDFYTITMFNHRQERCIRKFIKNAFINQIKWLKSCRNIKLFPQLPFHPLLMLNEHKQLPTSFQQLSIRLPLSLFYLLLFSWHARYANEYNTGIVLRVLPLQQ